MRHAKLSGIGMASVVAGAMLGCADTATAPPAVRPSLNHAGGATVVVTPATMDGWTATVSGTGQSVTFVTGPGSPPLGTGSAQLSVGPDGSGAAQLRNTEYAGLRLDALEALSYATYVQRDGSGGQAPYLILQVDYDGNGSVDDLLFFEPIYQDATFFPSNPQQSLALNTWQTWDALNGGWWSVFGTAGTAPGTGVKSLEDFLAVQPNATIVNSANGAGGVRIVAGFGAGAWDNFVGNVDDFILGDNGQIDVYDFDPTSFTKESCKNGGWQSFTNPTFKNQGACVSHFARQQ